MVDYYYISVISIGFGLQIRINDIPIISDLTGEGITTDEPINRWIKPGENKLSIRLEPPAILPENISKPKLEVKAFIADPASEAPKPGQMLRDFTWPDPDIPVGEITYPYTHTADFPGGSSPSVKLWDEAETLSGLTDHDHKNILHLINQLRQALINRQTSDAFSYLEYRYAEEARSEGKTLQRLRDVVIEQYDWMYSMGDITIDPLVDENASFELVGNNQVVFVEQKPNLSALHIYQPDSDLLFGIPVFLSKIKGQWTIVG
ncbi:MAG: hypothetical protein B6244_06185 [Candidatus Cloacimonetes bacterium 4572_55]|nr:MAG: hypothetical protein B6244_06185 [Candidatus Cloacimonetes bacterium 4572_55]